MNMLFLICNILHLVLYEVYGSSSLPSIFYKPGHGTVFDTWLSSDYFTFKSLKNIPNYPGCPTYVQNGNSFATNGLKTSNEIDLLQGYRYEITAYHIGYCTGNDYFKLGVQFPDGTENKPIESQYLLRSMDHYKWTGLLAQKYDSFSFEYEASIASVYSRNPSYPGSPSSFTCKSSLYDPYQYQDFGNSYALRYIGYLKVPSTGVYKFKMWCNEICEFFITRNNVESSLGSFIIKNYANPGSVEMNAAQLSKDNYYPIKAFMAEGGGSDYIRITYKEGSNGFRDSWDGMLQNLEAAESILVIPIPVLTMLTSTTIKVTLPAAPTLPQSDNWVSLQSYEILYYRVGDENNVQKLTLSGAPPVTINATGLNKYTDYSFHAHYLGKIGGEDQHIISKAAVQKTDEDVPDTAPSGLAASAQSSTSIKATWRTVSDPSLWNGVGTGYELQYKVKNAASESWVSEIRSSLGNRQFIATGLLKYTVYEFKVAGRTSKGTGLFSAIVEERTMEDIPSAAPVNISAQNTSSSSIQVSWDNVPSDHKNGIITGYKVYIKKAIGDHPWTSYEVTGKSFTKSGLDLWTFYDVRVSAKTSVGEGTISNATRVRTDEDKPSAPPTAISTTALSSRSLKVDWSVIEPAHTNGIITAYVVKYKRVDGKDLETETTVNGLSAVISNLAEYVDYRIEVAGITSKGPGVFSTSIIQRTLEDVPHAPPVNLRGNYKNSTAIQLYWEPVPEEHQNGRITNYTVKYREKMANTGWKNLTVSSPIMQLVVCDLDFYTLYEFKIAASTSVGLGPFSNVTEIRTDADVPSKSPQNFTGHFLDHRSIAMKWDRVPEKFRHGIILGYRLFYKDISIPDQPWKHLLVNNSVNGTVNLRTNVTGLKIYTPYAFMIQAFNIKAFGKLSENVTVWTDEYAPEEPPRNITGRNATSTEIVLKWKEMDEVDGDANGKVIAYIVKYHVIDCHEDRPTGCDEHQVFNISSNGSSPEIRLPKLRKFTNYSFSIQAVNSKGKGNFSHNINVTTDEDKPDASPTFVETWPSKFDAIKVYWSPIPESLRNGIILGYRIFYKSIDTAMRQYHRAPRAINPFAVYGAEPGEKMKEVNATTFETEIAELKDFSWYQVRIGAFTSKGLGVTNTINGTTKQGVPIEAPELHVADMYGFYEALLSWDPIKQQTAHGEVIGYKIEYWLAEAYDFPVPKTSVDFINVFEPNRTVVIEKLDPYGKYGFRIQAFTEGGFGVWSKIHYGNTCRCPKLLSSARIPLLPLANEDNLKIIPQLVDEATTSCCGNCSGRHGISYVDWQRDALNNTSIKYSREQALQAIANGTHLALPIFNDEFELQGDIHSSEYVFIPILNTRNVLVFMKNPTRKELGNAASSVIISSLWEQWPLLLLSTVITILAGIVFWILESSKNEEDFSKYIFRGWGSGLWLAYITMTTVGYGDLVPKTKKGRIYTVAWTAMGLVLTSMIIGNLSSLMAIDFVFKPVTASTNGKVLTSEDLFMVATQFYGRKVKIGNVSDGHFIKRSLMSGNVSRVLVDFYRAGALKAYLDDPGIVLEKVLNIQGSFGIALSGEAKRIKSCVSRYAKEREKQMLEEIRKNVASFEISLARRTELIRYMIVSESDILEMLTKYGGILLLVLVLVGAAIEIGKKCRGRAKVTMADTEAEQLLHSLSTAVNNLERDVSEKMEYLQRKHEKEMLKLNGMQYGQTSKLVAMYPDLNMFDPAMPKSKKSKYAEETPAYSIEESELPLSDEESFSDMPIDYRTDF
eukprot:gene2630-826_t